MCYQVITRANCVIIITTFSSSSSDPIYAQHKWQLKTYGMTQMRWLIFFKLDDS